jgi:hypothetical protein
VEPDPEPESLELTADLDAHAAEALRLEIRRLARRHGLEVGVRIEPEAGGSD